MLRSPARLSLTSSETRAAKQAFKVKCAQMGVKIQHYHADNGRFCDRAFVSSIHESGQTISFCGVSAHHQNEIAEKRIRDIQEHARKMILHAAARWPSAITNNLWPYALRHAVDIANMLPNKSDGTTPQQRFSSSYIQEPIKNHHMFGAPVYALNSRLQNQKSIPKWDARSRLGVYLGNSPRHSRSISLVLDLITGHVSPQLYVIHDDFFRQLDQS